VAPRFRLKASDVVLFVFAPEIWGSEPRVSLWRESCLCLNEIDDELRRPFS